VRGYVAAGLLIVVVYGRGVWGCAAHAMIASPVECRSIRSHPARAKAEDRGGARAGGRIISEPTTSSTVRNKLSLSDLVIA